MVERCVGGGWTPRRAEIAWKGHASVVTGHARRCGQDWATNTGPREKKGRGRSKPPDTRAPRWCCRAMGRSTAPAFAWLGLLLQLLLAQVGAPRAFYACSMVLFASHALQPANSSSYCICKCCSVTNQCNGLEGFDAYDCDVECTKDECRQRFDSCDTSDEVAATCIGEESSSRGVVTRGALPGVSSSLMHRALRLPPPSPSKTAILFGHRFWCLRFWPAL